MIGLRYAASLFELGDEENCLEALQADMKLLHTVFTENSDFFTLLCVPTVTKEEKFDLLQKVFGQGLHPYTDNFLHLLIEKRRISALVQIAVEFERLCNEKYNIRQAVATTAVAMTEEQLAALKAKLEQMTGKNIRLENRVDASLKGGVTLQLEGEQYDSSVRGRLDGLRAQLQKVM